MDEVRITLRYSGLLTKTSQNTMVPRLAIFNSDHIKIDIYIYIYIFKDQVSVRKIDCLITEHGYSKEPETSPRTVQAVPGRRDPNQRLGPYSFGGK